MIVMRLKGGLGNQMFQYALGRVLSIKNNTELVFNIEAYLDQTPRPFKTNMPARHLQLDVFNIVGRVGAKNEIPFLYRMYGKGKLMLLIDAIRRRIFIHRGQEIYAQKFNPVLLSLGQNTYLDGFFQSPKYFAGYEDIIRKDFTLKSEPDENIKNLYKEITGSESLCVHIRRGDFVGSHEHEIVNTEYYHKALEILEQQISIEKIYVFSDDIQWCKENISFKHPTLFVGPEYLGEKDIGNLYLMSGCKNFIIPNSTFSWWAVWLSENKNKKVVAPKVWSRDVNADVGDLILEEWIKI